MQPEDNTFDPQTAGDDANSDALFNEFAGGEPANDPEPPEEREPNDSAGQPRDDQGRFATDGEDDPEQGEGDGQAPAEQADPQTELERYRQEAQQWQHRYQSDLGRQSALQRKIQEQQQQIEQLQKGRQQPEQKESGENPEGSGLSDQEWEALKQDFPDIAKALDARLGALSSRYEQEINQLKGQMEPIQQQAQEQMMQAQYTALEQQHPDWRETVNKPEFSNWLQQQPPAIQKLKESDNAADAAYLLSTFKLTSGAAQQPNTQLQQRRQRQLQSAQTVPNRGGRPRSAIPDTDEDALFDYFASQ